MLKIIGAGFGRTGTASLKEALEHLGYPCYHMEEAVKNVKFGHFERWNEAFDGETPVDWDALFGHYEATVDFPGCLFYKELMEAYPDASVILSVRDSESWWRSMSNLVRVARKIRFLTFLPFFRAFCGLFKRVGNDTFGGDFTKDNCIEVYERHVAAVKAAVPESRLLIYSVEEGWEPLCAFIGKPVPEIPFPHSNSGVTELKQKMRMLLRDQLLHRILPSKLIKGRP